MFKRALSKWDENCRVGKHCGCTYLGGGSTAAVPTIILRRVSHFPTVFCFDNARYWLCILYESCTNVAHSLPSVSTTICIWLCCCIYIVLGCCILHTRKLYEKTSTVFPLLFWPPRVHVYLSTVLNFYTELYSYTLCFCCLDNSFSFDMFSAWFLFTERSCVLFVYRAWCVLVLSFVLLRKRFLLTLLALYVCLSVVFTTWMLLSDSEPG